MDYYAEPEIRTPRDLLRSSAIAFLNIADINSFTASTVTPQTSPLLSYRHCRVPIPARAPLRSQNQDTHLTLTSVVFFWAARAAWLPLLPLTTSSCLQ